MNGKVGLIVGDRGTGKTSFLRSLLLKVHPDAILLHDVGGQYGDIYKKPILPFDEFKTAATKVKNGLICFEEATIFVQHHPAEELKNILVRSRYNNNTIFFVFHSLRSVPRYIYDLCDVIFLLKTKDTLTLVEKKFEDEKFTSVFNQLKSMAWLKGKTKDYSPILIYKPNE